MSSVTIVISSAVANLSLTIINNNIYESSRASVAFLGIENQLFIFQSTRYLSEMRKHPRIAEIFQYWQFPLML